jgi:hypothetical protein
LASNVSCVGVRDLTQEQFRSYDDDFCVHNVNRHLVSCIRASHGTEVPAIRINWTSAEIIPLWNPNEYSDSG